MDIQLKKGVLEICILAILLKNSCSEYELSVTLQEAFETSEIIIYSMLKKLQKDGMIVDSMKELSKRSKQKFFSITFEGKKHFESLKCEWYELNHAAEAVCKILDCQPGDILEYMPGDRAF